VVRDLRGAGDLDRLRPQQARGAVISRRGFLLASVLAPLLARAATAAPKFSAYPFTLGVASGYPAADGVALWTRLAPRPLEGGGMAPVPVEVRWEVAEDRAFRRIVRRGAATAAADNAHAVHVEVDGLSPAREYWYRFIAGSEVSPEARTRTAPEAGKGDDRLRLALASCQQYEQGHYVSHRHLAAENVDLVAFVGDYIYESSWGRDHVRKHPDPEPRTLADYRNRYALYKGDADLQSSHAAAPWIVTWDDHEVDNDYADDRSEDLDPDFLARRAAAYKAFYEHMPMRRSVLLASGMRIYGHLDWGSLARLHVLDNRQYRSHQVCPRENRGGSNVVGAECTARVENDGTMLGAEQERWLDEGLGRSRALWNLVVQQTLFVPAGRQTDRGLMHWTDGWDGYPKARERLLRSIVERRPSNPVILGGDVHFAMAADVHADPREPGSPIVATELMATSITSQGRSAFSLQQITSGNPHIRFADSSRRGYGVLDIGRKDLEARLRAVATVKLPDAPVTTAATLRVESGKPGIQ
jgi:alkaline phosphatase D